MNTQAVILFDGQCNFCNFWVNFIIKHDKKGYFKFAPLQSERANELIFAPTLPEYNSVILIEKGKIYALSNASLRIARRLDGLWKCLYIFIIIPPFIRNWVYRLIAKNRYLFFGKRDECMIPDKKVLDRFLI